MTSYRFRRRSFLASVGGAFGLSSLLANLEAAAQGQGSPPRFLLMFWPCGTVPHLFRPSGTGSAYVPSAILQPFETAGLRDDLTVLYGLKDPNGGGGSGGHEGGVPRRTTGALVPGTRFNEGGEGDDGVAGGPSFDQIFLKRVPAFAELAQPTLNAICDARVDAKEISAQCLSYSYETRDVLSVSPGGVLSEHVPLMPDLKPADLYARLFSSMMPGGNTDANRLELGKALQLRKSVLDYALGELDRLNGLAPASERPRIEIHASAIRSIEKQLSDRIAQGADCEAPVAPDPALVGQSGSKFYYGDPTANVDESVALAELGQLHLGLIRAAFQCDIARVATFQWASSLDPVSFHGLYPADPTGNYRHHPMSHKVVQAESPPSNAEQEAVMQFLANVHTWFNEKTATFLKSLKESEDIFGESLLSRTVVPFVTDVAAAGHTRGNIPALVCGGQALGMRGGQYLSYESAPRPFNDFWLSLAQAFLPEGSIKQQLADEIFVQQQEDQGLGEYQVIPELWVKPT